MDLHLTSEQEMIRQVAREFADKELLPTAAHFDELQEFPTALWKKLGEMGMMGLVIPEEWGGAGVDTVSYVLALEEIARGNPALSTAMSVNNSLTCYGIWKFGTAEQKRKYLIPLAQGQKLGGYCLTEAESGSDAAKMRSTATLQGDKYLLNGSKIFITSGISGHIYLAFAITDKTKGSNGISCFIVEKSFPGFKVGKKLDKLGMRASDTTEIIFENCEVPVENLLGEEGAGFKLAMQLLDGGRIGIATQALGIAQAAYEFALRYANERQQFGHKIYDFQAIQFMVADMATRIEAARLLVYKAASMRDQGKNVGLEASMAKLFASETAMKVTTDAVQIYGGYGYIKEYPVERYFRDAKVTEIYEGTSQIQRLVIARNLLRSLAGSH
ncbi:MAG: acyl-CoA dehydrogenase [Chloroflexi bacterium]|uniref:Acyl-CoA dehydrogenase n=1 Tax=Candidatus Chlorohelix allophototropha TaxID=3003348 RepID=A0A8T7LYQ3_9CHLR|nr:acyl-CoA dehydrogenase [Chloroflexota bacterium]WJW66478.1 acyl-CoA dehydrogenase [Chloroflexota bacterium L227-S17]